MPCDEPKVRPQETVGGVSSSEPRDLWGKGGRITTEGRRSTGKKLPGGGGADQEVEATLLGSPRKEEPVGLMLLHPEQRNRK